MVCLAWLTGCLLRLYRGTAGRHYIAVTLCTNYNTVTTFRATTWPCFYLCHVDHYGLVLLFAVQVHNSLLQQFWPQLSHFIDSHILAVLAGLWRHLRWLIYFRIYWCAQAFWSCTQTTKCAFGTYKGKFNQMYWHWTVQMGKQYNNSY